MAAGVTPGPRVEIEVEVREPAWEAALPGAAELARKAAAAALAAMLPPGFPSTELSLVLSGDAEVQALNRAWRGKDRPTNVLSFPGLDSLNVPHMPAGAALLLGDVVLAHETCAAEAAAQGKTLAAHLGHLVVHGVLHLLGHDHEDEAEASTMETAERAILDGLGIADPYDDEMEAARHAAPT
jgi:probable rRNA maturation factor